MILKEKLKYKVLTFRQEMKGGCHGDSGVQ